MTWTLKNSLDVMQELLGFTLSYVLVQSLKMHNTKGARPLKALQTFSRFHSFVSVEASRFCLPPQPKLKLYCLALTLLLQDLLLFFFFCQLIKSLRTQAAPSDAFLLHCSIWCTCSNCFAGLGRGACSLVLCLNNGWKGCNYSRS